VKIRHLALLSLGLCACRGTGDGAFEYGNRTITAAPQGGSPAEAAWTGGRLSTADRAFVEEAVRDGQFELESSALALEKDVSAALRDLAQRMLGDHGQAQRELARLAQQKALAVPPALHVEQRAQLDALAQLQGEAFERAYREAEIEAHDKAIALFERAAREGVDEDVKAFALRALPSVREHRSRLDAI
jgi:putative membrane protein